MIWGVVETDPAKYCLSNGMSPSAFQLVFVVTVCRLARFPLSASAFVEACACLDLAGGSSLSLPYAASYWGGSFG